GHQPRAAASDRDGRWIRRGRHDIRVARLHRKLEGPGQARVVVDDEDSIVRLVRRNEETRGRGDGGRRERRLRGLRNRLVRILARTLNLVVRRGNAVLAQDLKLAVTARLLVIDTKVERIGRDRKST